MELKISDIENSMNLVSLKKEARTIEAHMVWGYESVCYWLDKVDVFG